jgi:hypothetical protein
MPSEYELSHQVLQNLGRLMLVRTRETAALFRRIVVFQLLIPNVDDSQRPVRRLVVDRKEYLFKCDDAME